MSTNSRQFSKYKDPVLSWDRLLERSGIMPPGRYRGFDTIKPGTPVGGKISFKLSHDSTGVIIKTKDGLLSDRTGISITPQGTIIHEEGEVSIASLVIDYNTDTKGRRDIVVLEHLYKDNIPGVNPPTYLVIKGTPADTPVAPAYTSPLSQVVLGVIDVPAGANTIDQIFYHPEVTPEFSDAGRLSKLEKDIQSSAITQPLNGKTYNLYQGVTNTESEGTCTYDSATKTLTIGDDGNIFKLPPSIATNSVIENIVADSFNLRANTVIFLVNNTSKLVYLSIGGNLDKLGGTGVNYGKLELTGPAGAISLAYNLEKWVPAHTYIHKQLDFLRSSVDRKANSDDVYTRAQINKQHSDLIANIQQWVIDNFSPIGTPNPLPDPVTLATSSNLLEFEAVPGLPKTITLSVTGGDTQKWRVIAKPVFITLDKSLDTDYNTGDTLEVIPTTPNSGKAGIGGVITIRSTDDPSITLDIAVKQESSSLFITATPGDFVFDRGAHYGNIIDIDVIGSDRGVNSPVITYPPNPDGTFNAPGWVSWAWGLPGQPRITFSITSNPLRVDRTALIQISAKEDPSTITVVRVVQRY